MKRLFLLLLFLMVAGRVEGATFGNAIGTENVNYGANDCYVGKFTLTEAGTISKITVKCRYVTGACNGKAFIYDDDGTAGEPNTLLGVTPAVSVSSGTAGEVDFTFSSGISLSAGDYYLGLISEGTSGHEIDVYYVVTPGTSRQWTSGEASYSSPGAWGQAYDAELNNIIYYVYATYTTSGGSVATTKIILD